MGSRVITRFTGLAPYAFFKEIKGSDTILISKHSEIIKYRVPLISDDHCGAYGGLSAAEHVQQARDLMDQTGYRWPDSAVEHLRTAAINT